jgi:four helix bundle protein
MFTTRPGRFPEKNYGLTSQIRRASSSIPANIAEGCGRGGNAELKQFLQIALGPASELEYHLLLARDLHYLTATDYDHLAGSTVEIKKMLTALIAKVKSAR